MTKLIWDKPGARRYETGIENAVLFLSNTQGVPWNGLVEVSDSPTGGTLSSYWVDGVKYLDTISGEDYSATLSAYTYPDEFEQCQGLDEISGGLFATAQPHNAFSLAYRTRIGNDIEGVHYAYRIHLIWNAIVTPLPRDHKTLTNSVDAEIFKWDISAVPIPVPGMKPTAHLIIDSRFTNKSTLTALEAVVFGSSDTNSHLPSLENLLNLIMQDGTIVVVDNGDGTWTATGPDEFITMLDADTFQITEINAVYLDANTYQIGEGDAGGGEVGTIGTGSGDDSITDVMVDTFGGRSAPVGDVIYDTITDTV